MNEKLTWIAVAEVFDETCVRPAWYLLRRIRASYDAKQVHEELAAYEAQRTGRPRKYRVRLYAPTADVHTPASGPECAHAGPGSVQQARRTTCSRD